MHDEAALWAWFLFDSKLPPQRGKVLLEHWASEGRTLRTVLAALPGQAAALGLTPAEAALLRPPAARPPVTALRWDDPLYPDGLRHLPLKVRPALLFYRGAVQALQRPVVYQPPAPLTALERETAHELIAQLLGEGFLPAAFQGSPQAELLLAEMADAEGETLLFARCGSGQLELAAVEAALLEAGRLLLVSPLPPTAAANPAWDSLLEQLAAAVAYRLILTAAPQMDALPADWHGRVLYIAAEPPATPCPPGIQFATEPGEVLFWLAASVTEPSAPPAAEQAYDLPTVDLPPLAPEAALQTLEGQGRVPEVLRQRLLARKS